MPASSVARIHRALEREYQKHRAPVVELIKARTRDPFKILISTILSARTKDETTAKASIRLFKKVNIPADLKALTAKQIERLIYPVGFYRTKAKHLKALPGAMDEISCGKVPDTIDDLCKLPGVGRKTANLVVVAAFDKPGICVDVHVHRISNRLGLLRTETPFETEMALRKLLPGRYWKTWNRYLVSFGQTICRPIGPKCAECPIYSICKRVGVDT